MTSYPSCAMRARRSLPWRNYTLGIGLAPYFELFGRFAEYQYPRPGSGIASGPRDISANAKWQLPLDSRRWPKIALGLNDIGGGAVYFDSVLLALCFGQCALLYSAIYARLTQFRWCISPATLSTDVAAAG